MDVRGRGVYALAPSIIQRQTADAAASFFDTVLKGRPDLSILQCLMYGKPALRPALGDAEKRVADALVQVGLLHEIAAEFEAFQRDILRAERYYIEAVVAGFRAMMRLVIRNRAAFIAEINRFRGFDGRFVARSTNVYGLMMHGRQRTGPRLCAVIVGPLVGRL